jgi:hypothetical protein
MDEKQDRLDGTERRARELFDASVDALDGETRARLGRARHAAVSATERRQRPSAWLTWAPAAAVASLAIVAVLLWRAPGSPAPESAASGDAGADFEAVEVLADGEDFDLLENDLEFYEWLDAAGYTAGETQG